MEAATEVNKVLVMVVPGGGVGMRFCCCMLLRFVRAFSLPCSAANWYNLTALVKSFGTP